METRCRRLSFSEHPGAPFGLMCKIERRKPEVSGPVSETEDTKKRYTGTTMHTPGAVVWAQFLVHRKTNNIPWYEAYTAIQGGLMLWGVISYVYVAIDN